VRGLRFLVAIPAIAGLAIMGAAGASAAPAHQAAHARMMTVTPSTADPYTFENANGLWIVGSVHGLNLVGSTVSGTAYVQYPQPDAPGYYAYSINDLCWNTLGGSGDPVGMDSCPSGDSNEWFLTPPTGGFGYIETWSGLCIWGAGNGKTLFLKACSGSNNRDLWYKESS
jgi:hypothetical protein